MPMHSFSSNWQNKIWQTNLQFIKPGKRNKELWLPFKRWKYRKLAHETSTFQFPEFDKSDRCLSSICPWNSRTKGASVLLYPDAAIVGFLTFPENKEYYEYNTAIYKPAKTKGLDRFSYAKRFYSSELGGQEEARKKAIEFAEKNNKKYMELVTKEAPKYEVD